MQGAIAVLDVGKTNKKLLVFDGELRLLEAQSACFPEIRDPAGETAGVQVLLEDTEGCRRWVLEQLGHLAARHPIRALAVSAHGATFACLDGRGELALPVVSYTTEPGEAFHEEFFAAVGDSGPLQRITATPRLPNLLNLAQGIFFVRRHYPESFARTRAILGYAQYYGHWLTGAAGAEPTYTGCHTHLWDFRRGAWSVVAERLGILELLPPRLRAPWEPLGPIRPEIAARTGLSPETVVPMGIHDSNAALLPYLLQYGQEFVLNSTGTWCVAMRPSAAVNFADEEIGKGVLYNMDVFGRPVKTSIFTAGLEYDAYAALIREITGVAQPPPFDPQRYLRILRERELFILPGVLSGTGQFPDSRARVVEGTRVMPLERLRERRELPTFFRDAGTAFAVLNLSLALQTRVALLRAGFRPGLPIFTEGGFRRNVDYNRLLSALFPGSAVCLTGMQEASACGAALLARAALEGRGLDGGESAPPIERLAVPASSLEGIEAYSARFLQLT